MKLRPADLSLQLMDVIKEQQKTIDKLTDKLMSKSFEEYKQYNDQDIPPASERMKEPELIDFMDADGQELMKSLSNESERTDEPG